MNPPSKRRVLLIAVGAIVLACLAYVGLQFSRSSSASPAEPAALTYVGTETCASCHTDAYQNWRESDHRQAMDTANADSVLGDFNDATFDYAGVHSRFFMRDGKYFVETDNADGELETFPIAYTFGHYPLQQYLIEFPDGRLQALSIVWDSRPAAEGGQRWYHLYPDQKVAHDNPLHWTGAFQNWNSRCASCHTTNLVKNYSPDTDRYDTQWSEINVGCEACHGPGSRHVAWAENGTPDSTSNKGLLTRLAKSWDPADSKRPDLPVDFSLNGQVQVCSDCHSGRLELRQPTPGANYFDMYSLGPLVEGRYAADGQFQKEEVYETGSFLQSKMHRAHVSCSNCHEPHSGHLRIQGNGLCLQCHDSGKYQTQAHLMHEVDSEGAQCVNCHMPQQTYMVVDARRDHSFRVPDPIASVELGVPNACTQCHTDRSDQWAADLVSKHTGRTKPYYSHAPLIAGARKNDASVADGLLDYARDRANPPILREIAMMESAHFASPEEIEAASEALRSPDPLVRIGGATALGSVEDLNERLKLLQPVLHDPRKSVRMVVARQLANMRVDDAPAELRPALAQLLDEYRESLLYNADMPESMNDLGLLLSAQGDAAGAEQAIQNASKLAPRYLPSMLNLSDLYRAQGREDLGEKVLEDAIAEYPESGDARHALGLLYVRTGRVAESLPLLEEASRLAPDNPRYALVYAVALVENGRRAEGIRVLRNAARRFPYDEPIRSAVEAYETP